MIEYFSEAFKSLFFQHHLLIVYVLAIIIAGLLAALISRHKDYQKIQDKLDEISLKLANHDTYVRTKFSSEIEIPNLYNDRKKLKQLEEDDDDLI